MEVKILASGSEANCVYVAHGEFSVLIDIGLPKTKAEKIMLEHGINPTALKAIFLTHEHNDHVRGAALANKLKIPVYGTAGTLKGLDKLEWACTIKPRTFITFGDPDDYLLVRSFSVHHDAYDPVGYVIESKDKKVSVMMDTGRVDDDMIRAMWFSDTYVFECNHDVRMLENGPYHDGLKARILADTGHLSNADAAAALSRLVRGVGEHVYLTHMSSTNNNPVLAVRTVERSLKARGLEPGKQFTLEAV